MAQGSHKVWGQWETRVCAVCDERMVLSRSACAALTSRITAGCPIALALRAVNASRLQTNTPKPRLSVLEGQA